MQDTRTPIPDDEIDFRPLLRKVADLFSYLWHLMFRNAKTLALFIALAVAAAIAIKYLVPKTYRSSFVIRPNDHQEKFHLYILGNIQTLLKIHDKAAIASELKIAPEAAKALTAIALKNSAFGAIPDSVNFTEVELTVTDYNQFIPVQNALLNYLESSPHFSKLSNLQMRQIDMQLEEVNKDLRQLDSLKALQLQNYAKQQFSPQSTVLLNELIDPTRVYQMSAGELAKKETLMARKEFLNNFQLIKGCIMVRQHSSPPRILVTTGYLIPVFLLLCLLYLVIREQVQRQRRKNAS